MPKLENLESYPPMFRPTQEPDPDENQREMDPNLHPDPLPIIDMECLDEEELERAGREWGIFRLVNHGVPTRLLEELQEHAKRIFQLPYETKQGLGQGDGEKGSPLMRYFWGTPALTPAGVALPRATGPQNVDWVEGFNVSLSMLSSFHHHQHHSSLIDDFSYLLEDYVRHLQRIGSALFEAMMKRLKMGVQEPSAYLDESTGLIRVYRYPPSSNTRCTDEQHVYGMHVHTDSSVLSILNQDQVGGLQFLKDDRWFHVKPIPNTLVVNLGDMMQALSEDEYKSVKHKVTLNKHKERVSICYFVFPNEKTVIKSSKYKPFTYQDFRAQVQHDVKTLGSKIGLDKFRIPL